MRSPHLAEKHVPTRHAPQRARRLPLTTGAQHADFNEALYAQLKNAPWVASSLAVHALVFGIFLLFPSAPAAAQMQATQVAMAMPDDPTPELPDPPEVKDPDVETPIDQVRPLDTFVPSTATEEPGREDETGDDKVMGDPAAVGSTLFDHMYDDAAIGIRAGGPGRFGDGRGKKGNGGAGTSGKAPGTEIVVDKALRWLRAHQSPDGRWDGDGFDAQCKGVKCSGVGEATHDAGLTGLALLAFLGKGHTHQAGEFSGAVRGGLKFLRSIQDAEGCIGTRTSQHFQYDHAIATLAMAEAYGMTSALNLRAPAQQAVDFIHKSRNPYLAWRYGVRDGDNDTSVTGWMVMALKSAKMAGLEVDPGAFRDAATWVDKMTDPEFGKVGYQHRGGMPARTTAMETRFPASQSESLTAVGVLTRIFCGQDPKTEPAIQKGLALMRRQLPKWDTDAGTIDMYYWYYGTLATFQAGGESWQEWNRAMKPAIVDRQRSETDACTEGSWDPEDPWAPEGGRVYSTAVMCLCLEVYERYPRVCGVKGPARLRERRGAPRCAPLPLPGQAVPRHDPLGQATRATLDVLVRAPSAAAGRGAACRWLRHSGRRAGSAQREAW
jgi:hypothetical protein